MKSGIFLTLKTPFAQAAVILQCKLPSGGTAPATVTASAAGPRLAGCCLVLLLLLASAPRQAAAATVVSNLGNALFGTAKVSDEDEMFGDRSGKDWANAFTTGTTVLNLNSVTLDLDNASIPGGGFMVSLYSNLVGLPGVDTGVTFTGSSNPATAGLYTYTASAFSLDPSTTYWLVASVPHTAPDKSYGWNATDDLSQTGDPGWGIGANATRQFSNGVGGGWTSSASESLKFSVQASSAVPEPSRALLLLSGLGMVLLRRKRQ